MGRHEVSIKFYLCLAVYLINIFLMSFLVNIGKVQKKKIEKFLMGIVNLKNNNFKNMLYIFLK